jgi:large subunit ribosomal protein L11
MGVTLPVIITVYNDRSFEFIIKSPPASVCLKQVAGIAKGAANPRTERVGQVTKDQVKEIAARKFEDLNARDIDHACRIIEGTARSMGITVVS